MTQHYQKNVTGVTRYCPTCGKNTMHRVDDNRVSTCTEPHVFGLSKKQEKREAEKRKAKAQRQPGLFDGGEA